MITPGIEKAINEQIGHEEQSSRIYLSMGSWCQVNGFPGSSAWLYAQAEEERFHQSKLMNYLNNRGGHALLSDQKNPPLKFKSILDIFQQVLHHEEYISASINEIYAATNQAKDFSTSTFLQWFINEQIEEENTAKTILDKIRMVGDEKVGLYEFDKEMAVLAAAKTAAGKPAEGAM